MSSLANPAMTMTKSGDGLALGAWVRRYSGALRRYFRRRVPDTDVEDLLQDVFQRLQAARLSKPIEDPERYIFTVARNVLVSHHRRCNVRHATAHDPLDIELASVDEISPERVVIGRQECQRAIDAILALPPRARAAFQFHRFENMTYDAIAEHMGISRNSVKELISRALVGITSAMDQDRLP